MTVELYRSVIRAEPITSRDIMYNLAVLGWLGY